MLTYIKPDDIELFPLKLVKKRQKQPPGLFYKKVVLKSFPKFTGKHLCRSFFFDKVAGLKPATSVFL